MKNLKVKSIVIIIIAILISNNTFAQDNGTVKYTDKAEFFEGQKTKVLKVNFAGNFWGTTKITYEQILKPGRSLELKGTLIDMGSQGGFGSVGYKFYKKPTFVAPGMQRRNILEGAYLKPEVFVGMAHKVTLHDTADEAEMSAGVVLNIGNQWVVAENVVVDAYFGVGAGTGDSLRGYLVKEGLVITSGLNFGFAF